MTASEHRRLVQDAERWKAEAGRLRRAIHQHRRDVQGPGPAESFGAADQKLWDAVGARGGGA